MVLWYCTSAFLVTQSSYWYQNTCPCDLGLLWNWPLSGAFVFHKHASLCSIQKWHMKHWDWTWSIKSCYEHAYIKICLMVYLMCMCWKYMFRPYLASHSEGFCCWWWSQLLDSSSKALWTPKKHCDTNFKHVKNVLTI